MSSIETGKTLGAQRVGYSFNPSQSQLVQLLKADCADVINMIDEIGGENDRDPEIERWKSIAMTKIEEACMFAVKAAVNNEAKNKDE